MKPYITVTEVVNGTISFPCLFSDVSKAEEHFNACVEENNAAITYTDEFSQHAEHEDGYRVALHMQIEIQR